MGNFSPENEQGETVTVNGNRYRALFNEFLLTKIKEKDISNIWFEHLATLDLLRPVFEDCIISCRADVVWPPRSSHLTPLDYYLWDAVKDKRYAARDS